MPRVMLILRGNADPDGKNYPDEKGNVTKWPDGALHVGAAEAYARLKDYVPVVLDIPGHPQSEKSPQATRAVELFRKHPEVTAFYGFSGGGINLWYILNYLAKSEKPGEPEALHRIDRVVVIGTPERKKPLFRPIEYDVLAKKNGKVDAKTWKDLSWELVYHTNPKKSAVPKDVLKGNDTHMFGPDVLLWETKDKDRKVEDDWQNE